MFFVTFPALRHEVHTVTRLERPFTIARTSCRLGIKRRLVTLWAWETLCPNSGFFPQTSHTLDISILNSAKIADRKSNLIPGKGKHFLISTNPFPVLFADFAGSPTGRRTGDLL
jgi:hypothetical protein